MYYLTPWQNRPLVEKHFGFPIVGSKDSWGGTLMNIRSNIAICGSEQQILGELIFKDAVKLVLDYLSIIDDICKEDFLRLLNYFEK